MESACVRTRRLTVHIPAACEVGYRDGSELRFATTVAGTLDKSRLAEVEGLKTKVLVSSSGPGSPPSGPTPPRSTAPPA